MIVLKKVTFYWNHDRYEAYSKIVRVDSEMSNKEIVKSSESTKDRVFYEDHFKNNYDGIITDFEVKFLEPEIIDLTKK